MNSRKGLDSFAVAKKILQTPGPFVTLRMVCRLTHCTSAVVWAAMEKLQRENLGEVNGDLSCFYKCLPVSVEEEHLQLYGCDIIQYSDKYRKRNTLSNTQWATLMQHAPHQREVARYFAHWGETAFATFTNLIVSTFCLLSSDGSRWSRWNVCAPNTLCNR